MEFSDFRKLLLDELEKSFPKDYQAYRNYRQENEAKDNNNAERH